MTGLSGVAAALPLLFGGLWIARSASPRAARRRALLVTLASLTLSLASLVFVSWTGQLALHLPAGPTLPLSGGRHLLVAGCVNAVIGVVVVALAPLSTHRTSTFVTIVLLIAIGSLFLSFHDPVVLATLWVASTYAVFRQLRYQGYPLEARLFAIYQIPSATLFVSGAVLLTNGDTKWGTLALLGAIALREAVIPLHSWFIRVVEKAPLGLVVAFVAPQLGVYAHIELLHHAASASLAHFVAGVGALSALLGSLMALGQTKALRAAAYLALSQTGLVAFGLENTSAVGWSGAVLTWLVSSMGLTAFLLCIGAVHARRGELTLYKSAGAPSQLRRLGAATLLSGLATVGAPFSLGFIAEDLLVQGSINEHPLLGLGLIVVTALNGITVMRMYFGLFTAGEYRPGERDVSRRELLALSLVLGLLILGGLLPGPFVSWIQIQ